MDSATPTFYMQPDTKVKLYLQENSYWDLFCAKTQRNLEKTTGNKAANFSLAKPSPWGEGGAQRRMTGIHP